MLAGKWVVLLLIALGTAVAGSVWVWKSFFDLYHLATVQQGVLYRDGLRSIPQLAEALRRVKAKTVISLLDDRELQTEPGRSEAELCSRMNIGLVRIPITLGGWPSDAQVRQFLSIVTDPARQPVLVHCAQGVRRTGMMAAAYQESVMRFSREQAKAALLAFGHSQRTVGDVQRFIDLYDPDQQRMTQELPLSTE